MTDLFVQLGYALGIGLLIGLERSVSVVVPRTGQEADAHPDRDVAGETLGMRSFAVLSVVGYASALAGERYAPLALVGLLGATALVVAMYWRASVEQIGITTETAALGTVLLGFLCRTEPRTAVVLALALTLILAAKRFAWDTIRKMRWVELTDTLKLLVLGLIVLPLLPAEPVDPWGAFNPHTVGLLVFLISGVGFVGYFLTRILGARRGLGLTGIVGGLTSSTAVTASMAADARRQPELTSICAFSTVAANATMFGRVLVVVFLVNADLARDLAAPLGTMMGVAACAAGVLWVRAGRSRPSEGAQVAFKNPFSVGPALKFALFFAAILFLVRFARDLWGDQGLFLAAALSGLADVDAITLSISEQTRGGILPLSTGSVGIAIAVVSNSVVKTGIAFVSGGRRFGIVVGTGLGLATVSGLLVAMLA
ncbi:MAG: DUF4010 domain-containing protein [Deltaproteobacteria bacterium]|nr:DUF4010 domain-containing protein [Deltaproteobacteria bacterium]